MKEREYTTVSPQYVVGSVIAAVISGNVLLAIIICVGIAYYQESALMGIGVSAAYYLLSNNLSFLTITGEPSKMFQVWQEQRTIRARDKMEYTVIQQTPRTHPALPLEPPRGALPAKNFVPVAEDDTKREALLWALNLYQSDGEPNPEKVHMQTKEEPPGRLRVKAPAGAVREYLLTVKVLEKIHGGYRLAVNHYPTIDDIRHLYFSDKAT